jgi:hypothetical protein
MNKVFLGLSRRLHDLRVQPDTGITGADVTESDPLSAFAAESGLPAHAPGPTQTPVASGQGLQPLRPSRRVVRWPASVSAFIGLALAVGGLIWGYQQLIPVDAAAPRLAKLNIVTDPEGVEVIINNERKGVSPISVSLTAGAQTVTLRQGSEERVIPLTLAAGSEVTHHIEFRPRPASTPSMGAISVVTEPAGARVEVDGRPRGVSPLALQDLSSADHRVRVIGATGSAERTVAVSPGATTSVVFSLPRAGSPVAGWVAIVAPFDVQVSEGGNIVGTGRAAKIMLPAGRHTILLTNDALQFGSERTVDIPAGQIATLRVDAPKAFISANARPWAEVIIDGTGVGQTPIANLPLTIGSHEILFRHPQLGDRRQTVVVTTKGPNRVAVDLTK